MKVMTIFGTRPEIIRLSRVIPMLDAHCEHVLVYTGQNNDPNLSDIFFEQLQVRRPDKHLGVTTASFHAQVGQIVERCGDVMLEQRPDRVLILGDTNSGLAAFVAARMGIPVFHMEAGNRCFDDRVPEEINRRVIDHASSVLMPYTHRSKENLLREGIAIDRILVTGNPIFEVMQHYKAAIAASTVHAHLGLSPKGYIAATFHRAENVDLPERLAALVRGLGDVSAEHGLPVVVSVHPRTRDKLARFGIAIPSGLRMLDPLGFFDFVRLEQDARAVVTDSGTVQEECCIMQVPNVTVRDVTERPETVEVGSNILAGVDPAALQRAIRIVLGRAPAWAPPPEYLAPDVSSTVARIVLGYTR
jgi:UDP-N-acetylglucosamine 2-epimerase (non-hydrolysing)